MTDGVARSLTLADVSPGTTVRVRSVDPSRAAALAVHGILPGAAVHVEGACLFGDPRILRIGRRRFALARVLGRDVRVDTGTER